MEYPLNQSTWRRATKDTITAQRTVRFMWGGEGVLAVAGGTWLTQLAPPYAPTSELVIRAVIGGLGGLVVAVIMIFAFNLFVAPYKQRNEARQLLSEIPSKRKVITKKLSELYISGRELSLNIANDNFTGDAISLIQDWAKELMNYFYSEPDILGKPAIVRLSPRVKDWGIFGTNRLEDKERDYAFRDLSIKLEKLADLIMEIDK